MPELDFTQVINDLGGRAGMFEIARSARTPATYLGNRFLPERQRPTYDITTGSMKITPTLAGLSGMDSRYAQVGVMSARSFMERSAKITSSVVVNENTMRELQEYGRQIVQGGGDVSGWLRGEVEAIFNAVILQSQLDTMEYLRWQALANADGIDWTWDNVNLTVDYGIPTDNALTLRTLVGNTAYSGSASAFWTDIRAIQRLLRWNITAIVVHPDTLDAIIHNSVNTIRVVGQDPQGGWFDLQRYTGQPDQTTNDARDRLRLWTYGLEGEVVDPADPTNTIKVPFLAPGKMVAVGDPGRNGYVVGMGAQDEPLDSRPVGYTHIGPTVEGGGVSGRWGRMYVPQERPFELHGEAVTNGLPVIEDPSKIVIATTELPA